MATATTTTQTEFTVRPIETEMTTLGNLNWYEKFVLQRAHPAKMIFDALALMWGLYYLWDQRWIPALIIAAALSAIGTLLVSNVRFAALASTNVGQFLLNKANPVTITLDVIGYAVLIYSVWNHYATLAFCGVSVLALSFAWAGYRMLSPSSTTPATSTIGSL